MSTGVASTLSQKRVCPSCNARLTAHRYRKVQVDRCRKCGGVFFEPGESAQAMGAGGEVTDWTQGEDVAALGLSQKYCPCRGHRMEGYRLAFQDERLDVEVCLHCRGVWLDRDEARQLHIVVRARRSAASGQAEIHRGLLWLNSLAGLPVEEHNPAWRRAHWLTALIGLLAFIYLLELALLDDASIEAFARNFALVPARVASGEAWWTLFASMFVHAGVINVIAVLTFLKIFGDNVEDKLGGLRVLGIFLLSGLSGALVHVLVHPRSEIPILGADAALAGVIGAYVVLFPRVRIRGFFSVRLTAFTYALIWVLAQSVAASVDLLELVPTPVAWFAHLGGFATGAVLTLRNRAQRLRSLKAQRAHSSHGRQA